MMHRPWDCAQPDEWLPQSLRLCWGSGDSDGGGSTGGGDWGSAGAFDASGFDAGGIGAWGGSAYDASVSGTGMGGGGDWGSFGDTNYAGFNAPNPTFADVAGPNAGVTTGGGDWGSAGAFSAGLTGGGPGGAMFGADTGAGGGVYGGGGGGGGGGLFGDYGGGGGYTGGGGGSYGGGGGGSGAFGSFGSTGALGGSNAVAAAPAGPTGSAFADTYGGGSLAGPAGGQVSSGAPTTSEAQTQSAEGYTGPSDSEAAPSEEGGDTSVAPSESQFGEPAQPEAAPTQDEAAPAQDSFASRFDAVAPAQQDSFASRFDAATPDAEPSAFGPQSFDQQAVGEQGKAGQQQDSFDSRFGFDTSAPTPSIEATIPGGQQTDFDYGPGQQTAGPNFDQVFADLGIQPGWNPAEQMAGRTGLAEPTDWAANPYQPSTDVSVGRDFNQAFDPFGDTPTGMDKAGDQRSEAEPSLTFDEMWGTTPYSTLPNDQLSRSAQETLLSDFNYFPNPGYVQGPPAQTLSDRVNAIMNAIIDPVANVTMYPFARGMDALMAIPDNALSPPSEPGLGGPDMATSRSGATSTIPGGRETDFEYAPSTTAPAPDWGSVFEGAAPTEAQPAIEAFIPGGRETNFEYNVAPQQQQAPIDVEVVRSDDPSVPADPQGQPTTLPPAVEQPQEAPPQEAQPAPPPQEAQPQQPQEAQPAPPQEARPAPPSLIEQAQPAPPTQMLPAQQSPGVPMPQARPFDAPQPPGLVTMLPPPTMTPQVQPTAVPPSETRPAEPPVEHDDVPEPQDTSQPPQDPNAPRPPENIPGQLTGANGTYQNPHADTPQTSRTYRDSGRTDYPQGRPGIDFRTAGQAGIEPRFSTQNINTHDLDARLVGNINRALADMERQTGIPADSLVATSGMRMAHRGEAIEHLMDPRTSQESVYSRGNPVNGRSFPAARPGNSNHGHGRAIDFATSPALTWLRAHAGQYGLETIANDHPHIQLSGARGNVGPRPSAQEQAAQRTLDAQHRQAAIDRGLLGPGRGNQQAGVPTPRARPSDAPQQEVAQPRPPADVPAALPPPTMPLPPEPAPRPPGEIPAPAPFLAPPARGQLDRAVQTQNALNIIQQSTAKLTTSAGQAEFNAACVVAAKGLAAAGVPLAMAQSLMTQSAYKGAEKVGYGPSAALWSVYKSAIDRGIAAALQGYAPAKPGEVQGPYGFQPDAPGKQGAAPFGQQFADLSQSLGSGDAYGQGVLGRAGDVGAASPYFGALAPTVPQLSPLIQQPPGSNGPQWSTDPPLDTPTPGQFSPYRGNEAALPFGQQYADLSQEIAPRAEPDYATMVTRGDYGREGDVAGQQPIAPWDIPTLQQLAPLLTPPAPRGPPAAPPPPPQYTPGGPGMFNPFRGNEAALPFDTRFLAKGGHVDKAEPVVVGEEGPETFVPDEPGTVFPHMPQPRRKPAGNIDRWPKLPAPDYPGRYGGVEREMMRQTRNAQNAEPSLMDMVDSGQLRLTPNWHAMLNDPALIALGRSRMDDRREGIDPGAEQYGTEQPGAKLPVGTYIPTPAPAADPTNPMAQALGYGSIKRRPMQIGRQSYSQ